MKNTYSIPYPLDSSYLDLEITIQNDKGMGLRPFPIRNILCVLIAILGCFVILGKTFVSSGTGVQKIIFIISWFALCALLLISGKTKQLGAEKIPSLLKYIQPNSRFVNTRSMSPADPFIRMCGFYKIDDKGFIHYEDGSFGVVFDIVGNASVLLFNDHKAAILARIDTFYRKMRPKTTYHYVTNSEAQNVYIQVGSFYQRKIQLTVSDPDLDAMIETNQEFLENVIGNSYKSLHQYMIVQAPNMDEMNAALNIVYGETDNSELMFKFIEQLDIEETEEFMKNIYAGEEKHFN